MNPIRLLDDTDTTIAALFETQTESRTPVEILTDKTSGMTIAQIWETYKIDLMTAGIILILGYFLIRLIMRLVERHLRESKMERSAFTIITTVTKFLLYLILTLTAISKLGVPITSTLALFSTLALAITLAIKDGLTHLAGGIILLTSKPFVIGDHIECLADGATGYVTDIGPIHTKLRTPDGSKVYIPNGNLVASTVINHSGMGCRRIREIISIDYAEDFKKAERIVGDILATHPKIDPEPKPFCRVDKFGAGSVDLVAQAYARWEDYDAARFDVLEQIKTRFDQEGIRLSTPMRQGLPPA
ncbi:MAG TPA: mechanosensitive ion channel family protein [Oscillospiraceae bacterium]|nr:mechanosensitive ion channel family protein [Oscillospiraceae bacterium]HNW05335.1 mechanosensitive ion channel family protein [Oscillospiraceae bacterium]